MTAIVGITDGATVWMGGDRAVSRGTAITILRSSKVFKNHQLLLGCAGNRRILDLMQYEFQPPIYEDGDLRKWLVTDFIPAVRKCFNDSGFGVISNNEQIYRGLFLLGIRGRLFEVDSTYCLTESALGYSAIGTGGRFALGALYATPELLPEERIQKALEAATALAEGVRPPFTILNI